MNVTVSAIPKESKESLFYPERFLVDQPHSILTWSYLPYTTQAPSPFSPRIPRFEVKLVKGLRHVHRLHLFSIASRRTRGDVICMHKIERGRVDAVFASSTFLGFVVILSRFTSSSMPPDIAYKVHVALCWGKLTRKIIDAVQCANGRKRQCLLPEVIL